MTPHSYDPLKDPLTPKAQGMHMPAEWEPHEATWMTWPRRNGLSFPGSWYDRVCPSLRKLVSELSKVEKVKINVFDETTESSARSILGQDLIDSGQIEFYPFGAYEPWCRDHGPLFVKGGSKSRAIVNFGYNAWGGKYPPFDRDNDVPCQVAKYQSLALFEPHMILEGGSIEVNGSGTVITTTSCLLNPNRNPNLAKTDIEDRLKMFLGVAEILWLGDGIEGDDTDGHIDDITRFTSATTIATAIEPNESDPNHRPLAENRYRLQQYAEQDPKVRIVDIPMPDPISLDGQRMPASYLNFYLANERVFVPAFGQSKDLEALEIIGSLFPEREAVLIDSSSLIYGLGSFHCLTQQEPSL